MIKITEIYFLNFLLCLVIIWLGMWVYSKTKDTIALYIIYAFALFGLSHFASVIGIEKPLRGLFSLVRTLGYILVILALAIEAIKAGSKSPE